MDIPVGSILCSGGTGVVGTSSAFEGDITLDITQRDGLFHVGASGLMSGSFAFAPTSSISAALVTATYEVPDLSLHVTDDSTGVMAVLGESLVFLVSGPNGSPLSSFSCTLPYVSCNGLTPDPSAGGLPSASFGACRAIDTGASGTVTLATTGGRSPRHCRATCQPDLAAHDVVRPHPGRARDGDLPDADRAPRGLRRE